MVDLVEFMNSVLSILDTNGLTDVDSVREFVHKRATSELISLTEGLREAMLQSSDPALRGMEKPSLDQANFLPSSSLRGASGCAAWQCRVQKIRILKRYIALYCDMGVVPVNLDWNYSANDGQPDIAAKHHLVGSILALVELRPLIESGLAVVVPEALRLCAKHWEEAVPGYAKIVGSAKKLCELKASKFTATYEPIVAGNQRLGIINFTGPDEYLDHGKISRLLHSFPPWVPIKRRLRRWKIPLSTIRNRGLLLPFFRGVANDELLQGSLSSVDNARYVTDLPGELEFYQLLNKRDALAEQTASLCARLTHTIPLMGDVPIHRILRIRGLDPR